MAISTHQLTEYVAFIKSSTALWEKLPDNQKKDNTLYFVADSENDRGKLYLGNKLIADGSGDVHLNVEDLENVSMLTAPLSGDILIYNNDTSRWENASLDKRIGDLIRVFQGATESSNGTSGLVPQPTTGDINNYLRGDGVWADPTAALSQTVADIKSSVDTLVGVDKNMSVRVIAQDEANKAAEAVMKDLVNNAPDAFDTLGEIAEWIKTHPTTEKIVSLDERLVTVETSIFGAPQYDKDGKFTGFAGGGLENTVGSLKDTLETLVPTVSGLSTRVGTLEGNVGDLQGKIDTINSTLASHTSQISEIDNRLKWQELYEEETV